ncbi:MAG: PQQ-binding-like beta-propeller repeat protein [Planctomycetia bacterium]|nr:PQQ-binding-like beta-propeller repeat protein [Planctomycetia bacterium]
MASSWRASGIVLSLVVFTACSGWSEAASAQSVDNPLVTEASARRHGMVRAWWRQVDVDVTRDRVETVTLCGTTLYVQTKRGTINALDAETGRTRWVVQVGSPMLTTTCVGANDKYAAVLNGTTLYVLTQPDGKIALQRRVQHVPGAGPALSDNHVFIPTTTGIVEGYDIEKPKQPPWAANSTGRAMVQPFMAGRNSLCWATDAGYFYVADVDPLKTRFRVETSEPIVTAPGFQPPYLYVGSLDGHVYKVHEKTGIISWRFTAGGPVAESPLAVQDRLFVCARDSGLHCVLAEQRDEGAKAVGDKSPAQHEGNELWRAPGVKRLLAASKTRLYALDDLGRMLILRSSDGGYLDSFDLPGCEVPVLNDITDRVFFSTSAGAVQCLHEIGLDKPVNHRRPSAAKPPAKQAKPAGETRPKAAPKKDAPGEDLFEAGKADKGAGDAKKGAAKKGKKGAADADAADKGDANPFGGPAKKDDAADPFGGK